ncbi:MAG: hypothetical protein EA378_04100 [Phycisphaerales bacterium]|nr:MAG: hypothetical protein EA378_04100 [Phycisphaerales bacterium]
MTTPPTPAKGFPESTPAARGAGGTDAGDTPPKFSILFDDPRHFRGDCRLMGTAIRRGWLDNAPAADREALVARFLAALAERPEKAPNQNARELLAWCETSLAMTGADVAASARVLRYAWGGELPAKLTGRPRARWRVSDFPARIDANAIRRQALTEGLDPARVEAIDARPADDPDAPGVRVVVVAEPDARYGTRLYLTCPRCGAKRVHLYALASGVACRGCARIAHR